MGTMLSKDNILTKPEIADAIKSRQIGGTFSTCCYCPLCNAREGGGDTYDSNGYPRRGSSGDMPEILVSETFGDITKDYLDWPVNSTLTYSIFDREIEKPLVTTNVHSSEEESFIVDVVTGVDAVVELDFERSSSISDSQIVFVSVDDYRPWFPGIVGQVVETKNRWFVLWKDSTPNSDRLTDFDQNTIVHEFGHSIGLSHPGEKPNNPDYNTVEDTIMSYNDLDGEWGTSFTSNDIDALVSIWGPESSGRYVTEDVQSIQANLEFAL